MDDLRDLFGTGELPGSGDVETVGGLLASALGHVPIPGATATVGVLTLTAESAAGRRNQIGTVVVRRSSSADEDSAGGSLADVVRAGGHRGGSERAGQERGDEGGDEDAKHGDSGHGGNALGPVARRTASGTRT